MTDVFIADPSPARDVSAVLTEIRLALLAIERDLRSVEAGCAIGASAYRDRSPRAKSRLERAFLEASRRVPARPFGDDVAFDERGSGDAGSGIGSASRSDGNAGLRRRAMAILAERPLATFREVHFRLLTETLRPEDGSAPGRPVSYGTVCRWLRECRNFGIRHDRVHLLVR